MSGSKASSSSGKRMNVEARKREVAVHYEGHHCREHALKALVREGIK